MIFVIRWNLMWYSYSFPLSATVFLEEFKKDDPAVARNVQIPNNHIHLNFNDNVNSFITLFTVMAGNNWLVIEEIYIKTNNRHVTKLFLLSFYF